MKQTFIETKYQGEVILPEELIKRLPSKIVLALPVQFITFLDSIKAQLESFGKTVILFESKHGKHSGQILGCDIFKFSPGDAFLYVGDGKFHPTALLYNNDKTVYCYNPFNNKTETLKTDDLKKVHQRKKGQLAKFLSANDIGLLVTTKLGQSQTKKAEKLRTELEQKGKNVYVFLAEEINFASLENFNFVDVWINTACPRIVEDFKCLNIEDLAEIGY